MCVIHPTILYWPADLWLTYSQSIHFPQFATTRLSKIWFSRLTLISPYCYCDSYYYYYCYLLLLLVIIVITYCVRLYDLLFCILSYLIACPSALKVLANLTCGIWLCTNWSTICDTYVGKFVYLLPCTRRAEACRHSWLIRKVAEGASLFKMLLLFPSTTVFRDMQMHLRCN